MTLEEMLDSAAGPGIIRRALDVLKKIQRVQGEPRQMADAAPLPDTAAVKAALYAEQINQAGRAMRRQKDCRSTLRRAATDAEPELISISQQQRLDAFVAAEKYAKECRERWRKG
jgi:hypothetical protein